MYQGYTAMAILIKSKSVLNVGTVEFEFIFCPIEGHDLELLWSRP